MSKNDITGDSLTSKANSLAYSENYDKIFGSKSTNKPQQVNEDGSEIAKNTSGRNQDKDTNVCPD